MEMGLYIWQCGVLGVIRLTFIVITMGKHATFYGLSLRCHVTRWEDCWRSISRWTVKLCQNSMVFNWRVKY